jgi:hypothetical protein
VAGAACVPGAEAATGVTVAVPAGVAVAAGAASRFINAGLVVGGTSPYLRSSCFVSLLHATSDTIAKVNMPFVQILIFIS